MVICDPGTWNLTISPQTKGARKRASEGFPRIREVVRIRVFFGSVNFRVQGRAIIDLGIR